jgi:hypothetical protein
VTQLRRMPVPDNANIPWLSEPLFPRTQGCALPVPIVSVEGEAEDDEAATIIRTHC